MDAISEKSCFIRLKENAESLPNKVLLMSFDKKLTRLESFLIYCGYINQLKELGIKEDDVCLLSPSINIETPLMIAALVSIGAAVMLGENSDDFLNNLDAHISFKAFISFNDKWTVEIDDKTFFVNSSSEKVKDLPRIIASKTKPSFYFLTSGSSGKSKIVLLSEYSFFNHIARQLSDASTVEDLNYCCLPLNHAFGVTVVMSHLITGRPIFISNTRNPYIALETIEKYHCTKIDNVPTFFYMLMEAQKNEPHDISSFKIGTIAGGVYSKEQFASIEEALGITLCSSYGMTEGSTCLSSSLSSFSREERISGVGRPFPGIDLVLKDNSDHINKEQGEICFKGYNLMLGYLTQEGIKLPLDEEGYFHTGDIGRFDDNEILHITGRKKDLIIKGGVNISPAEIEREIALIDGVIDVCVVGCPDRKYGETICAYISSKDIKDVEAIKNIMKAKMDRFNVPSKIILKENIPLLPNGKHDKIKIKEIIKNYAL